MSIREYFDQRAKSGSWSSLYEGELDVVKYNFVTRRAEVLRLLEKDGAFERILDVGCGTGDYVEVARCHQASYHGLDFSSEMINQAQKRLDYRWGRNVFLVASGDRIPYKDNSFDLVLAIGFIEYFNDPTNTLDEIRRVLKPGGTLVIQSYKRDLFSSLSRLVMDAIRFVYHLFIKRRVSQSLWVDKPYSQLQLDGLLRGFGFLRTDYAFNNFYVLPKRFRSWFPYLYMQLSEVISQWNPKSLKFLAVNYIGKYVLERKGLPALSPALGSMSDHASDLNGCRQEVHEGF